MDVSLSTILKQSPAQGSRYTVTRPHTALFAISLPSAIGAFAVGAPWWIGASFAIAGLVILAVHLTTYIYCLINDRDAIRKESFTINLPAIEKSLTAHDVPALSTARNGYLDDHRAGHSPSNVKVIEAAE